MARFSPIDGAIGVPGPQGPEGPAGAQGIPGTLSGKFGAFQYVGSQSVTNTALAYVMPFDTTDFSDGVNISNTSHINFPTAGIYNIQWSGQFTSTSSLPQDVSVWLRINGTDVVGSTGNIWIPSKHAGGDGHTIIGWNYFLEFTAGQYLQLVWSSSSTDVSLKSEVLGSSPTKPSTAALILTATQIS